MVVSVCGGFLVFAVVFGSVWSWYNIVSYV